MDTLKNAKCISNDSAIPEKELEEIWNQLKRHYDGIAKIYIFDSLADGAWIIIIVAGNTTSNSAILTQNLFKTTKKGLKKMESLDKAKLAARRSAMNDNERKEFWADFGNLSDGVVEISIPEEKLSGLLTKKFKRRIEDVKLTQAEEFLIDTFTDAKAKKVFDKLGIEYPIPVLDEMQDYCKPIPKGPCFDSSI